MGRKKIKIARISDDRNRSVTYLKRKAGLMKKAHELAILTGSEVAVIVFGQNGKLTEFCSGDMDRVLLRYTEHTGPVERKGPEHYSNEDEDVSEDDGEGGDAEDGEGDLDDPEGGAGGGSAGMGGSSGRQYTPPDGGRNGSRGDKQDQGHDSAKSNKRKAPSGHKRKDGNGNSISSETSSKRGSPPYSSAPIIKVEGNEEESNLINSTNSVDKGALKAAIVSRSGSKPSSFSHHHSYSTGSDLRSRKLSPSSPTKAGTAMIPPMPHRPRTADASTNAQATTQAMMLFPQVNDHIDATASSSRFALALDTSNLQPQMNLSSGGYLQSQQWTDSMNPPQLYRASSASAVGQSGVSYGDLARGGINLPMAISYSAVHAGHSPMSPMQPQRQTHSHQSSLQLPMQMQGGQTQMIPLAHPILRQHPQYEQYVNQLRMQQQQTLGRNGIPMVGSGVHTAPSSPSHLAMGESQFASPKTFTSGANLGVDISTVRRSASFGYINQQSERRDFQQSLSHDHSFATNPFASSSQDVNLPRQESSVPFNPASTRDFSNESSAFGQSNSLSSGEQQQTNEASLSNADFNDLMGSIFSEMGSNNSTLGEPASNRSIQLSDEKLQESIKEQEEALRSMESNGSLSTLVNSESFDAFMADGHRKDMTMTSLDSPLVQQKGNRNSSENSQDQSLFPIHH